MGYLASETLTTRVMRVEAAAESIAAWLSNAAA